MWAGRGEERRQGEQEVFHECKAAEETPSQESYVGDHTTKVRYHDREVTASHRDFLTLRLGRVQVELAMCGYHPERITLLLQHVVVVAHAATGEARRWVESADALQVTAPLSTSFDASAVQQPQLSDDQTSAHGYRFGSGGVSGQKGGNNVADEGKFTIFELVAPASRTSVGQFGVRGSEKMTEQGR